MTQETIYKNIIALFTVMDDVWKNIIFSSIIPTYSQSKNKYDVNLQWILFLFLQKTELYC